MLLLLLSLCNCCHHQLINLAEEEDEKQQIEDGTQGFPSPMYEFDGYISDSMLNSDYDSDSPDREFLVFLYLFVKCKWSSVDTFNFSSIYVLLYYILMVGAVPF